jgi:hypothetical protein
MGPRNCARVYQTTRRSSTTGMHYFRASRAPQQMPTADTMSAAAEALAKACTHTKVKGSRRALLDTIAKLIPEGQTMTPAIADKELAPLTGYDERTIRVARDVLEEVGVIHVVGRGQGRIPSYELCQLPDAGGPPALPLRADLREVKRALAATPLLDQADTIVADDDRSTPRDGSSRSSTVGSFFRSVVTKPRIFFPMFGHYFGSFVRSWWTRAYTVGSFVRRTRANFGSFVRSTRRTSDHVLDVDNARARDVHTFTEVHTPPALRAADRATGPPCPYAGTVHAWCDGRVHVPNGMHAELLRRHGREPGDTDADVGRRLFVFYAETCAALPAAQSVGDDEFKFWRRAYGTAFASAASSTPTPTRTITRSAAPPRRPWSCPHDPPNCIDEDACIDRQAADYRAREQRKSR